MNKQIEKDYRKELWIAIATNVARAEDCDSWVVPGRWANETLKAFDAKFNGENKRKLRISRCMRNGSLLLCLRMTTI